MGIDVACDDVVTFLPKRDWEPGRRAADSGFESAAAAAARRPIRRNIISSASRLPTSSFDMLSGEGVIPLGGVRL